MHSNNHFPKPLAEDGHHRRDSPPAESPRPLPLVDLAIVALMIGIGACAAAFLLLGAAICRAGRGIC